MIKSNIKGSITVFISIVLSSIFLVTGVFSDAARVRLAQAQIQRAGKMALSSILAGYNNQMKDQYGIFGVYTDNDSLYDTFDEYFAKNLNINNQNFLYDFTVEGIKIEQPYNLEERRVFENQIMEFMKYRAPYEIANDLIAKVEGIKNISSGAKVYKRKMETDRKASDIGDLQMSLEDKTRKINEFNNSSVVDDLKNSFLEQRVRYDEVTRLLSDLQELYWDEEDKDARAELMKEIRSVREELLSIGRAKDEAKNAIKNLIEQFKVLNSEAVESSKQITVLKDELLGRIEEELKDNENNLDGIEELQKSYKESLSEITRKMTEDGAEAIIGKLEKNAANCDNVLSQANNEEDFINSIDQIFQAGNISYTFNKAGPAASSDEDNRDKVKQALNAAFDVKGDMKTIDGERLQQLPSRKANYQEENEDWNTYDFDSDNGAEAQLSYLEGKEGQLGQIVSNITEQLYLNEYIMGTFKHDVPLLKDEPESKAFNLRSDDKTKRDAFFSNFEVEYVINGNKDEAVNSMLVKAEILSIRLIANVIHIYTDTAKMARVTSLAAALSVWNAGLSTPLVETMLIFSWAMLESLYDVDQLAKGEKILLFKTKDQWKTDLSGAVDNKKVVNTENNPLCLSYQDYLKIFLLLMDKDKKLARVQDLVQLNVGVSCPGFLLQDSWVFLKAETTVSIKNLFVTFPAFTPDTRRNITRTYFSENIFMGY